MSDPIVESPVFPEETALAVSNPVIPAEEPKRRKFTNPRWHPLDPAPAQAAPKMVSVTIGDTSFAMPEGPTSAAALYGKRKLDATKHELVKVDHEEHVPVQPHEPIDLKDGDLYLIAERE